MLNPNDISTPYSLSRVHTEAMTYTVFLSHGRLPLAPGLKVYPGETLGEVVENELGWMLNEPITIEVAR